MRTDDEELAAINTVMKAMESLSTPTARARVMDYVVSRLESMDAIGVPKPEPALDWGVTGGLQGAQPAGFGSPVTNGQS